MGSSAFSRVRVCSSLRPPGPVDGNPVAASRRRSCMHCSFSCWRSSLTCWSAADGSRHSPNSGARAEAVSARLGEPAGGGPPAGSSTRRVRRLPDPIGRGADAGAARSLALVPDLERRRVDPPLPATASDDQLREWAASRRIVGDPVSAGRHRARMAMAGVRLALPRPARRDRTPRDQVAAPSSAAVSPPPGSVKKTGGRTGFSGWSSGSGTRAWARPVAALASMAGWTWRGEDAEPHAT